MLRGYFRSVTYMGDIKGLHFILSPKLHLTTLGPGYNSDL